MTAQKDSMVFDKAPSPGLGVEERSDEAPSPGAGDRAARPDPEVVAKPKRRQFSAAYRLQIIEEADRCSLQGLAPSKRGAKPKARNPLEATVRALETKVTHLERELHAAHTILDVQKKVAGLLGFNLADGKDC